MDTPNNRHAAAIDNSGLVAFSVAVNMDPDILLVDEALSVGDARFKKKSFERMQELCAQAGTILLVSHALRSVEQLCTDVAWMHNGELVMFDEAATVIEASTRFMDVGDVEVALEDI